MRAGRAPATSGPPLRGRPALHSSGRTRERRDMDEIPIRVLVTHATAGGSTREVAAHGARRPEDAEHAIDLRPASDRRETRS